MFHCLFVVVVFSFFKESCRFVEHTTGVLQNIGNVVACFDKLSTNNKHMILDLGVTEQSRETQDRHYKVREKKTLTTSPSDNLKK